MCILQTRAEHTANGGPQYELNFEDLEMQKWNIPMDRSQKVDEKNDVICLVFVFIPGVMVIKMSRMTHFLYFLLITSHSLSKIFNCIWKILFSSFRKSYGWVGSKLPLATCQLLKIQDLDFFADSAAVFFIFLYSISQEREFQGLLTISFSERTE